MILAKNKKTLDDILNKYPTNKPYAFDGKKPISTKSETKREQNKSSAPSLDDILNKYPTKSKYTFDGKNAPTSKKTTKKYTDFNSETQNAYASAKDKVTSKTTIKSNLSDTDRKKRIGDIDSELANLNKQLTGYSRASSYGTNQAMKNAKKNVENRIAELTQERKNLERVGTFSASELKQFEIEDAKQKEASARQKVNSFGARPTAASAEAYKQAISEQNKAGKTVKKLESEKAEYKRLERLEELNAETKKVTANKDFEQNSKYTPTKRKTDEQLKAEGYKQAIGGEWYKENFFGYADYYEGEDSDLYTYINDDSKRQTIGANNVTRTAQASTAFGAGVPSSGTDTYRELGYHTLTVEEKGAFNYLYHQDRINGTNTAEEYLKKISPLLQERALRIEAGYYEELSKESPVVMSAISLGTNMQNAAMFPAKAAATAFGVYDDAPILDKYGNRTQAIRGAVSEDMGVVGKLGYNAVMSIGDMGLAMAAGGGNAKMIQAIMSSSAGSSTISQAKQNGASDGKALVLGLGSAAIEWATERWSVEKILSDPKTIRGFILENTFTEATEEGASNISNLILDSIVSEVFGEQNEMEQRVSYLVAYEGKSEEEALKIAFNEKLQSLGEDILVGGLTGFGMSGVKASAIGVNNAITNKNVMDNYIQDEESLDALIEEGKASGEQSAKIAEEIEQARKNGGVTKQQIKQLIKSNEAFKQTADSDPLEQAAREVVNERNRVNVEASKRGKVTPQMLESLSRNNEVITDEEVKKVTGFGANGVSLVTKSVNAEGATFYKTVAEVKPSYEAGFENPDLDIKKAAYAFSSPIHQEAFSAGQKDGMMQALADKSHKVVVNENSGFKIDHFKANALPSDVTSSQVATLDLMAKALGVKSYATEGLKGNAELDKLTGEVPIDITFQREVGTEGNKQKVSIVFHGAHEMAVHRVVELEPEAGKAFVYAMYKYIAGDESSIYSTFNTLADKKRYDYAEQGVEISLAKAKEEVSASNILLLYNNNEAKFHKAIERIVNGTDTKAKQGLRKYIEILSDILRKVGEFLRGKNAQERAKIQTEINEVRRLRDMFEAAFAKAVENRKAIQAKSDTNSTNNLEIKINEEYNGSKDHSLKWRTDLNRTEYAQVEKWIRRAGNPEYTRITDTTNWYKGRLNGETVFAIYSDKPTILYERRGTEGKAELDILLEQVEEIENGRSIVEVSENINTLLSGDWLQEKHNLANNNAGLGGRGSNTGYATVLQGESSKFIGSQAFRNVVKNILDIQEARESSIEEGLNGSKDHSLKVTDKKTISFLENQEHITTYKAMQVIDGKLYPPMAAKTKGEDGKYRLTNPSELGSWQQAVEDTSNITKFKEKDGETVGYYTLNKGNGKSVNDVAYAPYEHSSNLVINDQFEEAHNRDNLVVVECKIPVSEMGGTYKAQYAHNSTGIHDWKKGAVGNALAKKGTLRKVYLTRWLKPVRILSDAETAKMYKETLANTGVTVPFNVVTPSLLSELEKIGVSIDYEGSAQYQYHQDKSKAKSEKSYSLKEKDSEGKTLTKEQADYFKDSKVRDAEGNLLVVYHGTYEDFTVFDISKTASANVFGKGHYFTNKKTDAQNNYASGDGADVRTKIESLAWNYFEEMGYTEADYESNDAVEEWNSAYEKAEEFYKNGKVLSGYLNIKNPVYAQGNELYDANGNFVSARSADYLKELGYDGIIDYGVSEKFGSFQELDIDTVHYVAFDSEQFKDIDNTKPTSNPDIHFSLKEKVEETKNLVAVHNMQLSELERTLDLGGLPMPSIAIIKAQRGHSEYGDVSLVFDKSVIDPKANKQNKVYGGDAWTPTYPTIEYKPNEKIAKKISDKYYDFSRKFGYEESRPLYSYVNDLENQLNRNKGEAGMLEELYNDTRVMQYYLLDSGKGKVEAINKETRTELTDEEVKMHEFFIKELGADVVDESKWDGETNPQTYRKNYMSKYEGAIREAYKKFLIQEYQFTEEEVQNVLDNTKPFKYLSFVRDAQSYRENGRVTIKKEADYEATQNAIREAAGEDYRKWVDSLFKGIEEKSGIRNNLSYYTNSGNQRSWEALHWENNLENVVKVMKSQDDVGSGTFFAAHSIWGVAAKDYRSIEEIKADSDRLKQLPEEEYNKIKESFGERLTEIANSIMDKSERNPFMAVDNAMECIVDAIRNSKTKSGILNQLKQYKHLSVTETTVNDIVALVSDIANMPTEYFEAKPKRAVELNEIATAIIPDNTSEATKTRLDDMGIKYLEYESGNEQSRLEALNSLEDVQFSLKETNGIDSKSHKELLDIIEHLKGEFEVTKLAKADPKKLEKMTRAILKDYSSKADFDETFKAIDELYQYMANGEDGHPAVWEDVYSRAYEVARNIAENALVVDDYMYQSYKHLRDYLRKTPMKFSEYDSVPTSYENFNEFRKMNIGRLKFTKDGMSIDSVYQELAQLYPEFFDSYEQTNSADQLEQILNVLDELRPTTINPFDRQIDQVAMELANDLTSRFFDIPQAKPTYADKAERRVVEERIRGGKKVEAVRQQRDEKIKKLIESQREKTKKQLDKLRQQRDAKVEKEKEKRRDSLAKMSESQKAKVLRARIIRHTGELSKKLVNPTDNQHIPYELQGAVATLLEHINLESNYTYDAESDSYRKNDEGLPTKRTQAFHELQKVYANIASSVVVDPDLLGEHGLLSDVISLGDKRIADMTSSELEVVWQTIRAIEASVSSANKVFSEGKFATILEIAEALRNDNAGKKEKTELKGMFGKGKKLTTLDMLTPETYLHCLGGAGDSIFRMMRDAQDKHISIMKEVSDFTRKALKGVNVKSLEKTIHTVKLGGEDVKLSTAQLMELYVLMKREQAVDHILIGGILPDATEGRGLKRNTKAEPTRNLSMDEIGEALSILTDEQKKIADELQKFVSTVLSGYGNEASMKVYNYEKFLEKNYWTIRTNKQEIQSDVDRDTAVTSVANKGMAKGTKPHANTSVRIGSIFDTFASHSSDMATYAAWLGTSEDVNRIRNFVFWEEGARTGTVKGILDTVHGTQGSKYLEKLLTDISIGVKGTDNMNPFDKLVGNYKAASVGANLRVIIQQPTAILRAMDMINPIYITEGAVRPLKGWNEAKKYAPIAQWKDWGYFDINTGRQMKDVLFDNASLLEKTKQVGMLGASLADSLAWGQLWNAVKAETKAKHKELEVGSETYYETVAKRFTEIVDHTQVVDGILQRSQLMRSADNLTKMATSFMGEPTKQYNMAVAAAYDVKALKGEARKKAVGRLGRTAVALAVAGIVNACAQSFIDAMRDDDKEKKYWERWLKAFIGDGEDTKWYESNLADTFNPLTYVPFVKDVVSIVQGYDVKRMDAETITKTYNAITNMYKAVEGTGKYTVAEASAQLFAEIARLYGLPVANVKRDVKSAAMAVAIETDNYLMQYRMEKAMLNINYAGNNKNFIDILFNAYNNDSEAYEIIYDDMLQSRYDASRIKSGMESRMKKAEGVKETSDLSKRYMNPDTEKRYDSSLSRIKSSQLWKSANATQRIDAAAELYDFLNSTSETMEKTRAEAMEYGVDETEYTLWKLAIEMVDQPKGEEGNGSYDYTEKAEAVNALDLEDKEIAYFIGKGLGETSKEEINETLEEGIDMKDYINFKAATSEMKADKNAKGKSIPNSKKRKVVNYLNNAKLTSDEWDYFYYEIMNYKR